MAILTQKKPNIFYSGPVFIEEKEEQKQDFHKNFRKYSYDIKNFDYDTMDCEEYQMQSNSFPPNNQKFEKDIFKQKINFSVKITYNFFIIFNFPK